MDDTAQFLEEMGEGYQATDVLIYDAKQRPIRVSMVRAMLDRLQKEGTDPDAVELSVQQIAALEDSALNVMAVINDVAPELSPTVIRKQPPKTLAGLPITNHNLQRQEVVFLKSGKPVGKIINLATYQGYCAVSKVVRLKGSAETTS